MPRTLEQIKNTIFNGTLRRSQANYFGPGSVLDGLATDVANLIMETEMNQEAILGSIHLDTASDDQLIRFAQDFNVSREYANRAYTLESDKNIIVSTTTGEPLQKVLDENNIVLSGLRIYNADKTKIYIIERTSQSITDASSCFVDARSIVAGSGSNVQKGELNIFEKKYSKLKITNIFPILNGTDPDTSTNVKLRVLSKIESNKANISILQFYLSSIPGYGKATIVNGYDGPGTILICVQPSTGLTFTKSALDDIAIKLQQYLPAGARLVVRNYSPILVDIKTRVVPMAGISGVSLVDAIKNAITNYMNGLLGGAYLDISDLENYIRGNVAGIKLLSRQGNTLEEISFQTLEGSASLKSSLKASDRFIFANQDQIITLNSVIVNYE
jgi:hypothetical protein